MDTKRLLGDPSSVKITKIVQENQLDQTIYFDTPNADLSITPGQFVMIWVPEVDEVPMGVCYFDDKRMGITVRRVGEATKALTSLDVGDWIGVRGPFGKGYEERGKSPLVVGGGIGMAPLRLLIERLLSRQKVNVVVGAKEANHLLLYGFDSSPENRLIIHICTDDGSRGIKGQTTDVSKQLLEENEFDSIYTCGPELMMHALYKISQQYDVTFQASLERYMKCGCAICGTCSLDPNGDLVCREGPVFSSTELEKISEFGKYYRDEVGIKRKC